MKNVQYMMKSGISYSYMVVKWVKKKHAQRHQRRCTRFFTHFNVLCDVPFLHGKTTATLNSPYYFWKIWKICMATKRAHRHQWRCACPKKCSVEKFYFNGSNPSGWTPLIGNIHTYRAKNSPFKEVVNIAMASIPYNLGGPAPIQLVSHGQGSKLIQKYFWF